MYRVTFCALLVALAAVSTASAQEPSPLGAPAAPRWRPATEPPAAQPVQIGDLQKKMPAELWLYLNEQQRYDNAKLAVRRKAELRTEQRNRRMAARKWFGFSNARPAASVTPFTGTYSPRWTGNGGGYDWRGNGSARTIILGYPGDMIR